MRIKREFLVKVFVNCESMILMGGIRNFLRVEDYFILFFSFSFCIMIVFYICLSIIWCMDERIGGCRVL